VANECHFGRLRVKSDFWPKFRYLIKTSIFHQNFDFSPKFRFFTKISKPKIALFKQRPCKKALKLTWWLKTCIKSGYRLAIKFLSQIWFEKVLFDASNSKSWLPQLIFWLYLKTNILPIIQNKNRRIYTRRQLLPIVYLHDRINTESRKGFKQNQRYKALLQKKNRKNLNAICTGGCLILAPF